MTVFESATQQVPVVGRRRRVRGLTVRAVPSMPLVAQIGGGVSTLAGTYMLAGTALTLIIGGVAAVVLGTLREAGVI